MVNRNCWTEEELVLLRAVCSIKTNEELVRLFPRHTKSSIQDKIGSRQLSLLKTAETRRRALVEGKRDADKFWTPREIKVLKEHYPVSPMRKLLELLPRWNKIAIYGKGEKLGLVRATTGRFQKGNIRSKESRAKQAKTISGENNVSKRQNVRIKISKALKGKPRPCIRGELNSRWRGGYEPYYGPNWLSQRQKALERDNYTCQRKGEKENLLVHHIIAFRKFGRLKYEEANVLSNLITLCRGCHRAVENGASLFLFRNIVLAGRGVVNITARAKMDYFNSSFMENF